ncbi:MAG: acetyl-CoA carboxylase carboxyl transferase subunit alpha, partial [Clostridiales bacterium]
MNIQKLEKKWQNLENKKKTIKGNLSDLDFIGEFINKINNKQEELLASGKKDLSAWDRVYLSRHIERPKAKQWIETLFDDVFY